MDMTVPAAEDTAEKKKKQSLPYVFERTDTAVALIMIPVSYIGAAALGIFRAEGMGWGVFLFALLYAAAFIVYLKKTGIAPGRDSWFWLAVILVDASSYIFVNNASIARFNALFLRLSVVYFTAHAGMMLIEKKTGRFLPYDAVNILFRIPLKNMTAQARTFASDGKNKENGHRRLSLFLGLVLSIPVIVAVFSLLCSADDNFSELFGMIPQYFSDNIGACIGSLLCACILGPYLYGLMYGGVHKRYSDSFTAEKLTQRAARAARIEPEGICPALILICIMYIVFICMQGNYYIASLKGILPKDFTFSSYARQGFFELLWLCVLNLAIIIFADLFLRKKSISGENEEKRLPRWMDILLIVLIVLTVFLAATGIVKMIMYIAAYGMTARRLLPALFMIWICFVLILTAVSRFTKINVVRTSMAGFAAGMALLSIVNLDGIIATYNIQRYVNMYYAGETCVYNVRSGKNREYTIDDIRESISESSLAAVPALYKVWHETEDIHLKTEIESVLDPIIYDTELNRDGSNSGELPRIFDYSIAQSHSTNLLAKMLKARNNRQAKDKLSALMQRACK